MKIALFCTYDNGGAGRAALRLNRGLNQIGEKSTLFVKCKTSEDEQVTQFNSLEIHNRLFEYFLWDKFFNNIHEGNTISSAMYPSINTGELEQLRDFDIINLHWVPTLISVETIAKMHQLGKPIVWTLHDQNPMTGACHYTHGCEKYKIDCMECPQLRHNPFDATKTLLAAKKKYLPKELVVVTPSRWLADCARESAVFKDHRIEVIPNSLETDIYLPHDKSQAKATLGIPSEAQVILFGAHDSKERRKGLPELLEAMQYLKEDSHIRSLCQRGELYIIVFGHPSRLLEDIDIPYKALGYLNTDSELATAYSAADVVALPSLEDNLPNIMLEALACGTPVVAFATGGMVDALHSGQNGYLAPLGDVQAFAKGIKTVLTNPSMGKTCRQFVDNHYRLEIQASRYRELFQELVTAYTGRVPNSTHIPVVYPELSEIIATGLCDAAVSVQNEIEHLKSEKIRITDEKDKLIHELDHICKSLQDEKRRLMQAQELLTQELQGVYSSKSWRITAPLRWFFKLIR